MRVSELEGALLDYWVARAEGRTSSQARVSDCSIWTENVQICEVRMKYFNKHLTPPSQRWERFSPSANWEQGGPIIEHGLISVYWFPNDSSTNPGRWEAFIRSYDDNGFTGPTLLIAAMRAYVASKFGETVPDEVPA